MNRSAVSSFLVASLLVLLADGAKLPSWSASKQMDPKDSASVGHPFHWGANMSTPELIVSFGYPVEIHHVTTEDGYILELHRIPYGRTGSGGRSAQHHVVFLEHCLLGSSAAYVMNTPQQALAYILADAGYDVWLSNLRGSSYSRNHTSLDPEDYAFWNFSWDEMATYDVPASIDYVLALTGVESVHYVGWSMGTTVFWAMMSEKPTYNQKVQSMSALAPVAFLDHVKGLGRIFRHLNKPLDDLLRLLKIGEILPQSKLMNFFAESVCDKKNPLAELCYLFLSSIAGPDREEFNKDNLPVILSHFPAGTSVRSVIQYGQMMKSGSFSKFDFGGKGNVQHYGQSMAPSYNLSKVTTPVALFWGGTDYLANPTDVKRLADELPNVALNYKIPSQEFNHMDFTWAIHTRELVYQRLLEFINSF